MIEFHMATKSSPHIAIVGGGISGISAALNLYKKGLKNICIFEAANRIGGRIHTLQLDNGYIEMGAQWIHGQEGNHLYAYAEEKGLVADPTEDFGLEGTGSFCCENGTLANCALIDELIAALDQAKEMGTDSIDTNMYEYFTEKFNNFVGSKKDLSEKKVLLLKSVFRWFIIFETIDNSCDNLRDVSPLSYTEWKECDGVVDLINLKEGYFSVLNQMCNDVPLKTLIQLQTAVTKIESVLCNEGIVKVQLHTTKLKNDVNNFEEAWELEKKTQIFDHVIISSSIGFLKAHIKSGFFGFRMPLEKVQVISALGFGTINKIFLYFENPWWLDSEKGGFQVLWQSIHDQHSYPEKDFASEEPLGTNFPDWVFCIQAFDLVRGQPNMLMAWIGSSGAKEMEDYSNEQIGQVCGQILRQIVAPSQKSRPITDPSKVVVSRWHSNPFIMGSYSNRTVEYQNLQLGVQYNIDILAMPVLAVDALLINVEQTVINASSPLVLFSGEATDRHHYSTTHGAFRSGYRDALCLVNYYKTLVE